MRSLIAGDSLSERLSTPNFERRLAQTINGKSVGNSVFAHKVIPSMQAAVYVAGEERSRRISSTIQRQTAIFLIFFMLYYMTGGGGIMKKKLGIALGAGGARGIAHIGFLKALEEEHIRPDFISGSSMGSIIGACYAKGMSADQMRETVEQLSTFDIVDIGILTLSKLGLMRWTKVRKMMTGLLQDCDFSDLKIPFSCVAVDLISGKLKVFNEGKVIDAILASSSMPTVFRPVEMNDMLLVDGGVLCRVPVRQVKDMGADVVVAVDVLGKLSQVDKLPNVITLITRVYDIMDTVRTQDQKRKNRKIVDLWLEPEMGDVSQYKIKYHVSAYDAGYKLGKENAKNIRKLLRGEELPRQR